MRSERRSEEPEDEGSTPSRPTMKGKDMKHLLAFGLIVVTILCVEGAPWVAIGSIIGAWLLEKGR